ncbi:unnamed protein product [Trichogramma brassicae]|uniref:acid phosphatase n=1 Tax=Trichogramma brassicae TaxID=86971 RepID=A0A6H5I815_9HYME|nr:unnamed protein product [Trichogramma brassicae]
MICVENPKAQFAKCSSYNGSLYAYWLCISPSFIRSVFRHGDRTPKKSEIYPLDPHKNYIKSLGYGKLTNEGKNREYQLGVSLKKRYGALLGDDYDTSNIHAISTDYDRTKMSLLLLLAGFFPPRKDQKWNQNLNWQPIPIAVSADDGKPNYWNSDLCPKYIMKKYSL